MTLEGVLVATYGMLAAAGIIVWWTAALARRSDSNQKQFDAPHVVAELLTSATLLGSGFLVLLGFPSLILQLAGLGMLAYATVNAAGLL
ncbi:MAG TPA: hypothetical protein VFE91_05585, partial [Nitrososphaerales archaeon]|nr:hypothetical protein [Nitrososphaerales archaeon]